MRHSIEAAAAEGRDLDERGIAARMGAFMDMSTDAVQKGLNRYLRLGHPWKADYIEAFARATGKDVVWMVQPHTPKEVREATSAQALVSAVDARLDNGESRDLARRLNRILDHRPFFDLASAFMDLLLEAKSAESAALDASDLIRKSEAWSGKVRTLRGKKKNAKMS